jgi:hypothetical protein
LYYLKPNIKQNNRQEEKWSTVQDAEKKQHPFLAGTGVLEQNGKKNPFVMNALGIILNNKVKPRLKR